MEAERTDATTGAAAEFIDALGVAWSTHQLYPNPTEQPIFQRSIETLAELASVGMVLGVRSGGFAIGSEEIEARRDGVERLARRMFLHDIEALEMVHAPSGHDLGQLFRLVADDETAVLAAGGFKAALGASGVTSIAVRQRRLLKEDPDADFRRDDRVAEVIAQGADPEQFANDLMAQAGGDPELLGKMFAESYQDVYARVVDADVMGREDVVKAYVEAFSYFPEECKVAVLEVFIADKEDPVLLVFLDQFPGHELANLSPHLSPQSFALLLEYARVTTDSADARPEELLPLLQPEGEVKKARALVAERVGDLLREFNTDADGAPQDFGPLHAELAELPDVFTLGISVIRGLLECEHRPHRFGRVLRIWTGRAAALIREGRIEEARQWIRAVVDDPPFPDEWRGRVDEAFRKLATADVLDVLLDRASTGPTDEVSDLLVLWGPLVVDDLIEMLATEEAVGRRRALIEVLASVARAKPRPFLAHVQDSRWYVVRNLAVILGRSGHNRAAPALRTMLKHDDHRVRVEALRGLATSRGDDAAAILLGALEDRHERVRSAAVTLIRNADPGDVDGLVADALDSDGVGADDKLRLIEILAHHGTPAGRAALDAFASRKMAIRPATRALREAARKALKEASP